MASNFGLDLSALTNPLSPEDLAVLRQQIILEPVIREAIAKAVAAGLDMSQAETELNESIERAKKLIEIYG